MSLVDLGQVREALSAPERYVVTGRVVRASGLIIHAALKGAGLGDACEIETHDGVVRGEVVGFDEATVLLMSSGRTNGIREGARVTPVSRGVEVAPSFGLIGRVVDADLQPVDGLGPIPPDNLIRMPLHRDAPPPMLRRRIERPLETGIRVIDTLLTLGEGQRVAIMAGAGVGKSVLLGMLARATEADVVVVGLIGERGREVREFVERDLNEDGRRKAVVVAATSDAPPLTRVRASYAATCVAEYFRAQGLRVCLLMDSLTRFAMAQREIGLAAGEPPTTKGYPPSVFSALPRLVERAGFSDHPHGSITAIYTVLVEGDDLADPVADAARSTLDGHWVLSRDLAGSGHFPAIDVLQSVSRVMTDIVDVEDVLLARDARELLAAYQEARDLVEVGAYVPGSNDRTDRAIKARAGLRAFLQQGPREVTSCAEAREQLRGVVS